jgi:hypothetical protein
MPGFVPGIHGFFRPRWKQDIRAVAKIDANDPTATFTAVQQFMYG